jgi:hypothetical protein
LITATPPPPKNQSSKGAPSMALPSPWIVSAALWSPSTRISCMSAVLSLWLVKVISARPASAVFGPVNLAALPFPLRVTDSFWSLSSSESPQATRANAAAVATRAQAMARIETRLGALTLSS